MKNNKNNKYLKTTEITDEKKIRFQNIQQVII